jgi:hypothetical protein
LLGRCNLEAAGAAFAPRRGGADQLPDGQDVLDALLSEEPAKGTNLLPVLRRLGEPGEIVRLRLAGRNALRACGAGREGRERRAGADQNVLENDLSPD